VIRRRIPAKFTGGAATPPPERGTPCSICRDGPCSVSTRNVTPAATGCAPTPRPRTNAAIAARHFITFRHRWARGSGCARVHWEAIVRISGRADCIAGRRVRSRPRLLSPREKKRSGRWGDGRSWVRGTEVVLMFRRGLRAGCQGASPAWAVAGVPKARISRRTHTHSGRRSRAGLWSFGPIRLVLRYPGSQRLPCGARHRRALKLPQRRDSLIR
jgi:hypothetical protein